MSQGQGHRAGRTTDGDLDGEPMLVLGERGPDVEDTTLEELRREREELLRERAEAEQRIQEERDHAERQLEAERRRAERELLQRQRRIDDAERDLLAAERRVLRQAGRSGHAHQVPRVRRTATPLPPRGRLRAKGLAGLLAGAAAVTALGTLLAAGQPPSERQVTSFATLSEAQLSWDEATMAMDELVAQRMAQSSDGTAPNDQMVQANEALADQVVGLVEDALTASQDSISASDGRIEEAVRTIGSDRSAGGLRAAAVWDDQRPRMQYAVSDSQVRRAAEALAPGSAGAWWAVTGMLAAVAALVYLAYRDRAWPALSLLVGAVVTAVATMSLLGVHARGGELQGATQAWEEAASARQDIAFSQSRDLERVFGLSGSSSVSDEDYWTSRYYLGTDDVPDDVTDRYREVRAGFADAGYEEQLAAAPDLVEAAEPIWDQRRNEVSEAAEAVVVAAGNPPGVGPLVLTALGTIGLALAAIFVPSLRSEQLRTSSASGAARRPADAGRLSSRRQKSRKGRR